MEQVYVGLDVSDKSTQICVVDADAKVTWSGVCPTCPDALSKVLKTRAPGVVRVVLETGPLSAFLYHGLVERGVPVVCVCARHAHGVLSAMHVNKSDVHDAEMLARIGRLDRALLYPIHHRGQEAQQDLADLKVQIERALGAKCERCWNYSEAVGRDSKHPGLCERCADVMKATGA